uniref:Interleukin 10 receptor, beta n=1 Tax=Astyanax mexicanus TaxID=7994 RepID=A0A3B1J930_ASTMX
MSVPFSLVITQLCMANLPRPRNVRPQTLNTDYILKWDWDQTASSESSTTFTAQSLVKNAKRKNDWKTVCECTSEHHCDFTGAELYYLGMWLLRVRAQNESHVSSWVQIEFCPDRDGELPQTTPIFGDVSIDLRTL